MAKKFHLKRHWKPPFLESQLVFIVLAVLLCLVQGDDNSEVVTNSIVVHVDRTPFNLTFSLENTENYELQNVTCKSKKNLEIVGNDNHTCENLDPCSTYFTVLKIKLLNDENQAIIEKTDDETTEYIAPSTVITEVVSFAESINLKWESEHQTCISNFRIEAKSDDNSVNYKWTMTNEANFLEIVGLNPCQLYAIQLKTDDINNTMISNETTIAKTEYMEPGNVTLTIVETKEQMKVSWELLSHTTCVEFYHLKWTLIDCDTDSGTADAKSVTCESSANLTDPSAKEFIITGLQGCELYDFQFYINNMDTVKAGQKFTSPEQVPGPVTINSTYIESTTISLYWNPPILHRKCVDYYFVEISGPLNRPPKQQKRNDTNSDGTEAIFDGLDPCGQYNYTIVPQSLNGSRGMALGNNSYTKEDKPTFVRNHVVKPEPYSLEISWDPPAFADLCVTGYRLSGWDDEEEVVAAFDKTTTNTSVTVQNLKACVVYTVQIIPITGTMNDGEFLHIDCETASKAAEPPIVDILAIYPDRFSIGARETDTNNKCETIFARITCEARSEAPIKLAEKYVKGQLVILFNTDIGPLSPYTDYICNAALYNIGGWSANKSFVKRTEAYFPDRPENVSVIIHTNSSLTFSWNAPKYANGIIKLYITYFQRVEAAYFIPSRCSRIASNLISRETSNSELPFSDLLPYTRYSIQVAAQNEFGISECTSPTMVTTQAWISDPITNLITVPQGPSETDLEYKANVVLTWDSPCKSNGDIEYFQLDFIGERSDHDGVSFQRRIIPDYNDDGNIVHNETDLRPEYTYNVLVSVKTKSVDKLSTVVRGQFDSPAGIPQRLDSNTMTRVRVEAYAKSNPSKTAIVRFPADVLQSDYGKILYVALLLSAKDCDQEPLMTFGAMKTNDSWPNSKSWNQVYADKNNNCIELYQTTPLRWMPPQPSGKSSNDIEFIIGTDDCVGSSIQFCNGPLKPDTEYNLIIRLFTKSGYNDAALLEFRTDALIELTIILAGVSSCLLLAFVAGFIYLYVTKRIKWQRESCHGIEDSFGDIASKKFAIFYRELSKPEKIAREFKELTAVALDLSYSASEMGYNKNRYADIFPYDKNRVILDIDADGSDYINASFIDGYRRRKEYIATQGPKPESTTDFWRMVLQHNVRVVVMVTQFREGDVVKCHEYYPFKSKGICVSEKKKESFDLYDRTELSVVHEMFGLKQKVVHFYFKKWPDHGCPTDPMHLITFVRKVKAEKIPSYSPIVVHCSAGVGRTGTFIGLDIIMQRLKNESKINIYETVKKLRFQRMKMVQTLAQYTFMYACTYELVKHKNTRTNLKDDAGKKVSFESDPENSGPVLRNTSLTSRNGSDMGSISEHRQDAIDRPSNSSIPITFSGIIKGKNCEPSNSESAI